MTTHSNCAAHSVPHLPHDWVDGAGAYACDGMPGRPSATGAPMPTVGRVVHYVSHGTPLREDGTQEYTSQCRAAIITDVVDAPLFVCLAVLNPTGMFFSEHALRYDPSGGAGTWHWPERTDGAG